MKLKISNHSSFNLKGTGRNTLGNFYLGPSSEMGGPPYGENDRHFAHRLDTTAGHFSTYSTKKSICYKTD